MSSQTIRSTYLDHAATTPMRPEAIAAMTEELARLGNPSSLHAAGRRARRVVEESREQLAEVFGARPSELVFTSGGTEADNLAVKGLYWARQDGSRRQVLTTSVEHHAVLDSVRWLEDTQGAEPVWLGVDIEGAVGPDALRAAVSRAAGQVAVVSVMWANNEVGTVQPVAEPRRWRTSTASRSTPTPSRPPRSCRSISRPAARTRFPCPRTSWAARSGSGR